MDILECKLKNCYGIDEFNHEFDFTNTNVITVYAKNGLMKTSFAKTFKKIQDGKADEIRDEIFDIKAEVNVSIDGQDIRKEQVFVIKSFENYYESSSVADLLVDEKTKKSITTLLKQKNIFLKKLVQYSGLKIEKTQQGRKIYELEPTIVSDMNLSEKSFLLSLKELGEVENKTYLPNAKYSTIFDNSVIKKIKDSSFQNKIKEFCEAAETIYSSYTFFEKGKFTFPKLKNVAKNLDSDNFFVRDNKLNLNNSIVIGNNDELQEKLYEIEGKIKDIPEFQQIEKLLSDTKGILLRDTIENNPELIEFLKIENLDNLKKELWTSYIKKEKKSFDDLLEIYKELEENVKNLNIDNTLWKRSLEIFEDRFTVPYKMKISNLKGAIIGENLPRVEFIFEKGENQASLDRSNLEKLDVLSQGEKRSLYLLNIIFDIEKIRKESNEILFIVDDIADSFDYKNKYAIVEYLYEMATIDNFRMIILSHNFDFYRTISSRLNVPRKSRFIVENKQDLNLIEEKYQNQPFIIWKSKPDKYSLFALIPFVRNLIEYSYDKYVNDSNYYDSDYELLTNLLHKKENSGTITFKTLGKVYKEYIGKFDIPSEFKEDDLVIEKLYETTENLSSNLNLLEHKVLLSMACRLKAEEIMLDKINNYNGMLNWKVKNNLKTGDKAEFLDHVDKTNNMTRVLFDAYKQIANEEQINIVNEVNIMTPENIHINSFMYEPIMDMDINELLNLYEKLKELI